MIELFLYLLWLNHYKWKSAKVGIFWREWVTLSTNIRCKKVSPTNHCGCWKTRVIALSFGIKISGVCCLVLSQSMHVMDGRTDTQTELWLPRPCCNTLWHKTSRLQLHDSVQPHKNKWLIDHLLVVHLALLLWLVTLKQVLQLAFKRTLYCCARWVTIATNS